MQIQEPFSTRQFLKSRTGLVLMIFLAVAAFYLLAEHTAHVFGLLPYALLLLCPLLHFFMHGGHGEHDPQSDQTGHSGHVGYHDPKQPPWQGGNS